MSIHLKREIEKLKKDVLALGAEVESNLRDAVVSASNRDVAQARHVILADDLVDEHEVDIEEECLKLFALYQPVAADLRFIVAVLKINNDLERIGDLAVDIAERTLFIAERQPVDVPFDFHPMASAVQRMVKHSLDALVSMDVLLAQNVCAADDEVDEANREMFETVERAIVQSPENIQALISFLSISRCLERIGDHATNIAEDVIYMVEGDIIRHRLDGADEEDDADFD